MDNPISYGNFQKHIEENEIDILQFFNESLRGTVIAVSTSEITIWQLLKGGVTKKSPVYPVHFMVRALFLQHFNLKFISSLGSPPGFPEFRTTRA